ncbi:Metallo-dependent phosphatase [Boletus edulis]|uniref:Metallo-dependent phosphatase-like protein n=1 Tax=Boletus edulis BED1 TaxID=1328754 RepID=A0AAD4BX69_BOLED|nr:Metallo-dependent phosphatase [Boletus edulis]KAF8441547.1 Metallo-dependent phosphatase-like protein [Boletus edulis BED1]
MSSLYERRLYKSRLLSKPILILALRFIWVILVIWCEFGVFFYSLSNCRWPDKVFQSTRLPSGVKPTRVLLVTDARLRNPSVSALNSWFGYDSDSAYLRKSWRVASRLHPDVVIFLGDTFASGRYVMSETEYDQYYRAFESTFPRDVSMSFYLIPGNNDIGLGDSSSFSKDARRSFETHFGPLNRVIPIADHQFILLDAPGLVEEDYRRHARGETYDHWIPLPGGPIEFVQSISTQEDGHAAAPKILLSHIPLSRPSSKSCGPLREKGSIRAGAGNGYQTMLGKQTTEFLLKTLRPSVVFSGDNRDYCEVIHEVPGSDLQPNTVREVTVKSFSPSRHIRRPGFQLLSLIPPSSSPIGPTFMETPCHLPDTLRVFHSIHVPCFILTALVLLYLNVRVSRHKKSLSCNFSPISLTRHSQSSHLEPESAIWTPRTPFNSKLQTSPIAPFPLSARLPSSKSVPSYRASPMSTPQSSPLLSPITLFPSGDEGDTEEDHIGLSHYTLRRDLPYSSGWQGEHDDDVARDHATFPERLHTRAGPAPHFLPPPSSHHARARWSWSWSFVFWGRRRRITVGVPDWMAWRSWLSTSTSTGHQRWKGRGLVWRFASDCVSVGFPAVIAWAVIGWLLF